MFRIRALSVLITIGILLSAATQTMASPSLYFVPGQKWSIKSAHPTTASVVVGRVEKWKGKIAVHVSIIDIPLPQKEGVAGSVITIGHVAFEESALEASVDRLVATDVSPARSFEIGYEQWKNEQGDLSKMSVSETIAFGLAAMNVLK